ncbi:MAG: tetratricopeptide repeat protein [Deltaproteobacteria bacterium]|nr:tetratricopeptide repeat protein [Deltaproteobacteria bacterium]
MKYLSLHLVVITALLLPSDLRADPLSRDLAKVAALGRTGDLAASRILAKDLSRRYPQDYRATLQGAWATYQTGDYHGAITLYRRAIRLSGGAFPARLGLAWSLAKVGDRAEAATIFRKLREAEPANRSVSAGVVVTRKPKTIFVTPIFDLGIQDYENNATKSWAMTSLFGLHVSLRQWWLQVAYRYSHFYGTTMTTLLPPPPPPPIPPPPFVDSQTTSAYDYHEAFLLAGYGTKRFGASLAYSYAYDGSGGYRYAHIAGAKLRYSPFGDIVLGGTMSLYSDLKIPAGELSWKIPLGLAYFTPGIHLQRAGRKALLSGTLALGFQWRWLRVEGGGTYGDQIRPADLESLTVYSLPETRKYGGRLGLGLQFGRIGLSLSYAVDRLVDTSNARTTGNRESVGHYLNFGLSIVTGVF